ncbi:MAG TPA: aldehyde dehydrogenase family protein [Pantanalinema sp.]
MTLTARPGLDLSDLKAWLSTGRLNHVAGEWRSAASGATFPVVNPADFKEVLADFPASSPEDVQAAIEAASQAQRGWASTPAPQRGAVIARAIAMLRDQVELLAHVLSWECGKVIAEARIEVNRGINAMEYLNAEARRLHGQTIPSEQPGMFAYTTRRPVGVVALVTPWNFPFAIPAWKLVPALVAGNAVVLKPAEQTPLCAALIVRAFVEAGLGAGVLNLVHGDGQVGAALVEDPGVKAVSFTGSTAVGKRINQVAAGRLAKVQLELGGKNAAIVMADADVELAAREIAVAAWGSTGQRCTATSRVIVDRRVARPLVERLMAHAQAIKVGPGLDEDNTMGPLVNQEALEKVERYMGIARQEGATLAYGGHRMGGEYKKGYFFEPTLLTGVRPEHAVACEEVFGPVLAVIEVDSIDEALSVANEVDYGLSSAIFTRDIHQAFAYAERVATGLAHVNCATVFSEVHLPFGGMKDSGFGGREMGPSALDFYTETQTTYLKHG